MAPIYTSPAQAQIQTLTPQAYATGSQSSAFPARTASSITGPSLGRDKALPASPVSKRRNNGSDGQADSEADVEDEDVTLEYVQALHDYSGVASGSNVCLSFAAGMLIKVIGKHTSGWWDGQVDGHRGWFPSNYVTSELDFSLCPGTQTVTTYGIATSEPMGRAVSSPVASTSSMTITAASYSMTRARSQSQGQPLAQAALSQAQPEPRPRKVSSSSSKSSSSDAHRSSCDSQPTASSAASSPLSSTSFEQSCSHMTKPIRSAIEAIRAAVEQDRVAEYGPAATELIASVRAVLSATDCLTRESVILRAHATLARQRKQILAILAGIVAQAKNASRVSIPDHERREACKAMLDMADSTLVNVVHFLQAADSCGVRLQLDRVDSNEQGPSASAGQSKHSRQSKTSSKSLSRARSLTDVKAAARKGSAASVASTASSNGDYPGKLDGGLPRKSSQHAASMAPDMRRRPSIPAVYTPETPAYPVPAWNPNASVTSFTSQSSAGPLTPAERGTPTQPVEVYRQLALIHESLISTIAAFIGHVHAHSRCSPSSSFIHLIDMTRDTIDKVRETLFIIDIVAVHPALQSSPSLKALVKARENLYSATTALVAAARDATSELPSQASMSENEVREAEQRERSTLLDSATTILRASAELVNATKPLLLRKGVEGMLFIFEEGQQQQRSMIDRSESESTVGGHSDECTVQPCEPSERPRTAFTGAARFGNRTVSMLVRRASSLDGLREQFDADEHAQYAVVPEQQPTSPRLVQLQTQPQRLSIHERVQQSIEKVRRQSVEKSPLLGIGENRWSRYEDSARDSTPRPMSSLSERRGVPVPSNLQIQSQPASGSESRASGVTSPSSTITSPRAALHPIQTTSMLPYTRQSAGGEPMSRDEASRSSNASSATSFQYSSSSDTGTATTSPRSSFALPSPNDEKFEYANVEPLNTSRKSTRAPTSRPRAGSVPARLLPVKTSDAPPLPSPYVQSSPVLPVSPNDGSKASFLTRDYTAAECEFNADGNVRGASLRCLVERMTLHDQTIDPVFSNTFFLTFRMFTDPLELTQLVIARFNLPAPHNLFHSDEDARQWKDKKLTPIRLRVYNFFKTWLELHWRAEKDAVILDTLLAFARECMSTAMPSPAQRLVDLIQKRSIAKSAPGEKPAGLNRSLSIERLKAGKPVYDGQPLASALMPGPGSALPPSPVVSKTALAALRTAPLAPQALLELDPLELARQLTLLESKLFCAIQPEELIGQQFVKKSDNTSSNIRMMSSTSTRITGWIAEVILSENDTKKRTGLVKYFIKLGDRCHTLQNYNTLMAILAALNSSTIARLRKTWDGLSVKYKLILETLRKATEHARNYAEYRATIRQAVPPCLPFLGLYLTDITFCFDGNPATRPSPLDSKLQLVNFDRYQKIAKYVGDLQRFQQPYNLVIIPEIQHFLQHSLANVQNGGDVQALYRRSLMIEPRETTGDAPPLPTPSLGKDMFNWRS